MVIKNIHALFADIVNSKITVMVYRFFHRVSVDGWGLMSENNRLNV